MFLIGNHSSVVPLSVVFQIILNFRRLSFYINILLEWNQEESAIYHILHKQTQTDIFEKVLKLVPESFKYNFDRILLKFRKFCNFAENIKHFRFESLFTNGLTTHICI